MTTILVGVDGSTRTPLVVEQAARMAERLGGKLLLVTSVGLPPEVPAHFWAVSTLDLSGILIENSKKVLEGIVAKLPADLVQGTLVEIGTAWDIICRVAKSENVDLIVIGSHGYGGLDRLIGTTASRVVNHADRSVFVVRDKPASAG